jgi:hypothetical protein
MAEKGLLVGYSEASKAYRIYVPARRKVIVCRDVQFEEERALRRSKDLPTSVENQRGQSSRIQEEEVQSQNPGSQQETRDIGVQRETVGQDHRKQIEYEEEERDAVPQEHITRPRPKVV